MKIPPSSQIPPLWRLLSPSFCSRRVDGCSTEGVRGQCPLHSELLFPEVCRMYARARLHQARALWGPAQLYVPLLLNLPHPSTVLKCPHQHTVDQNSSMTWSPWWSFVQICLDNAPGGGGGVFQETAIWNSQLCCLRDVLSTISQKIALWRFIKKFLCPSARKSWAFPQALASCYCSNSVSVNLPAELCALFIGCPEDFVIHLYSKLPLGVLTIYSNPCFILFSLPSHSFPLTSSFFSRFFS